MAADKKLREFDNKAMRINEIEEIDHNEIEIVQVRVTAEMLEEAGRFYRNFLYFSAYRKGIFWFCLQSKLEK